MPCFICSRVQPISHFDFFPQFHEAANIFSEKVIHHTICCGLGGDHRIFEGEILLQFALAGKNSTAAISFNSVFPLFFTIGVRECP
jgi:hypothetical protein